MAVMDFLNLGAARNNAVASILTFPPLDTDGIARRMRLREKAQENGDRDMPPATSQSLDAVEQDIVNEVEYEAKTQFDRYLQNQKTYVERAGSLSIQPLVTQIMTRSADAIANFRNRTHNGANELYLLRKDVIETEQDLERFRTRHGLDRPVRNQGSRTLKFGVLAIILFIESIANGLFLAQGSTYGLLGGVGEALIIAFINVAIGAGAGRLALPWLTHRNWGAKLIAALLSVGYFALAVGFNLLVAHYRTAMSGDPFEAYNVAWASFRSDPLGITDIRSWMLFVVGLIFSIVAVIDGWLMDDPYPGYGRTARAHQEAAGLYTEQKAELLDELEEIKSDAEQAMDTVVRDIDARQGEYENILMKSHALHAAMAQHFDHLESGANTLLRFYRSENLSHRRAPAPAHFDRTWTYSRPSLETHSIPERIRDQIDDALKRVIEEVPQRRKELHQAYLASMGEYKRIDDLTAKDLSR